MTMPVLTSYYGNAPASENNAKVLHFGNTTFYFSYETLVAVLHKRELVVTKNYWGPTTAKHLNRIDGGTKEMVSARVTEEEFAAYVNKLEIVKICD